MSVFVNNHSHSFYSLGDSIISPADIVKTAKKLEMDSIAITDHGTLAGFISFRNECLKNNIKPIYGCEYYFVNNVSDIHVWNDKIDALQEEVKELKKVTTKEGKKKAVILSNKLDEQKEIRNNYKKYNHLIILAKNFEGYKNLIKIHNDAVLDGYYRYPRVDWNVLEKHKGGLIATSACLGSNINKFLASDNVIEAVNTIKRFKNIFGEGNFYLELQLHEIELQTEINNKLIALSEITNTPYTIANDSHYSDEGQGKTRALIRQLDKEPDEINNDNTLESLYIHDDNMLLKSWRKYMPGVSKNILMEAILNSRKIADSIEKFELDTSLKFPIFESGELTQEDFLEQEAWKGLKKKNLSNNLIYVNRLKHELDTVTKLGFASYFNVVSDIVNEAKKNQPIGPGRGSGSSSLLGYCLGITNVDPIQFDLYFERFLSAEKGVVPPNFGLGNTLKDIDIDFSKFNDIIEHKHDNNCICGNHN